MYYIMICIMFLLTKRSFFAIVNRIATFINDSV